MIDDHAARRELIRLCVLLNSFRSLLSPSERWQVEGAIMALTWLRGNARGAPVDALVPTLAHLVDRQAAIQLAEQTERRAPIVVNGVLDETPMGAVGFVERSQPVEN